MNQKEDSHAISDEINNKVETLKTVEDKIRQKYSDSPSKNQQSLKRFKQLQEYLKMAHRDVKINQNLKNETKRIVKGEIPLGTDTQIKHEVRESYPRIQEIKRRLKNCLSINCNFDEVMRYAQEYFGIDPGEKSVKHLLLEEFKRKKGKENVSDEDSIKLYKYRTKESKPDLDLFNAEANQNVAPTPRVDFQNGGEDDQATEFNQTNLSFTRRKWNGIDELIEVLREELDETPAQK